MNFILNFAFFQNHNQNNIYKTLKFLNDLFLYHNYTQIFLLKILNQKYLKKLNFIIY